jgi:hypothetical protein
VRAMFIGVGLEKVNQGFAHYLLHSNKPRDTNHPYHSFQ